MRNLLVSENVTKFAMNFPDMHSLPKNPPERFGIFPVAKDDVVKLQLEFETYKIPKMNSNFILRPVLINF